jgi:hypothetical protein
MKAKYGDGRSKGMSINLLEPERFVSLPSRGFSQENRLGIPCCSEASHHLRKVCYEEVSQPTARERRTSPG